VNTFFGIATVVFHSLLLAPNLSLAEPSGMTAGMPAFPCKKIIEFKDSQLVMGLSGQWVLGFWTGWNFANSLRNEFQKNLTHKSVAGDALATRLIAYCYENPDDVLMGAANNFYLSLPDLDLNSTE
jgi:hypothetical protein